MDSNKHADAEVIMKKLSRDSLMSLEEYAEKRPVFRTKVLEHKKHRHVDLGDHIRILFEDLTTIQYQVQEMLRIEKIFERAGIEEELDAYNPLIPDGSNLKATMMIEYDNVEERKSQLAKLIGVERVVYLQVEGFAKVHPIANEDLERETAEKTSSVHFLRFEFSPEMITAWLKGAQVVSGVDHPHYQLEGLPLNADTAESLAKDFDLGLVTH